jgi:zinc protease
MRLSKSFTLVLCCVLLAGLTAAPAAAQKKEDKGRANTLVPATTPPTAYSDVRRDSLLNDMRIITLERAGDATVKCDLVIRAGAMFDLVGKTGLAALTQETLLAVNPRMKEEIESLGAKIEWGVNWDTTRFQIETPANSFDAVFEILARLLVVENVRENAFKAAHEAQLNKVKMRTLAPAEQADAAFLKAVFGDHPYGHGIYGTEATLNSIKQADVYDFLKRFYIANNSSMIVVGDIPHERVSKTFKILFGGWMKGQVVPATFRQPLQVYQLKLVKLDVPDAANVELRGGLVGVKHTDPDFHVAEVMARILSARMKRDAEAAGGSFIAKSPPRILPGPFYYSASVPADKAQEISRKATEHFSSLASTPVTADELTAAKSSLAEDHAAKPIREHLRDIETFGLPKNHPINLKSKIDSISAADVQRVAKRLIAANAITVVALGRVNDSF